MSRFDVVGFGALNVDKLFKVNKLAGAEEEMLFYGRYLDKLEKRDGRWKILHRQVVVDWSKRIAVQDERESEAFAALAKGAHLGEDPLYPFLNSTLP